MSLRQEIEDFLYHEADLLDSWRLDEWLALLTADVRYEVPPNDRTGADPRDTLFTVADDANRLRARVKRLKDANAHAEYPHSRTRRLIGNVRILAIEGEELTIAANFVVHRFRRGERVGAFVGRYDYRLRRTPDGLRIVTRRATLDAEELGRLGSVSFIL